MTLAWVMDESTPTEEIARVHRCLRTSYEERLKKGHDLPAREQAFLDRARGAGVKQLPDVRGMLDMLDRAEIGRGGSAYWASHYTQFGLSSDFLHDSFMGVGVFAVDEQAGMMHVDLNPDVRVGLVALRWGAFYLVRCLDAVLRFAGLDEEADDLTLRYATFKDVGAAALDAVTDSASTARRRPVITSAEGRLGWSRHAPIAPAGHGRRRARHARRCGRAPSTD